MRIQENGQGETQQGARLHPHLAVLDGWRGFSILLVLAAHLLPLGPKTLQFNLSVGILGMVVFFNLSGFLITSFLLKDQHIGRFLIRRFFRVIPLAWLYLAIALALSGASRYAWVSHFLFFANMPPKSLLPLTDHIWSLCVEIQFYVGVAILVAVASARGLLLLPLLALFFTGVRVWDGVYAASISYYRIDEILAGCVLALMYHGRMGAVPRRLMAAIPQWPLLVLLILSCTPQAQWLNYFRPYLAALLIGATVLNPATSLVACVNTRVFVFLAGISYSLYVIHPMLAGSWLGSGEVLVKYAKRPLLFIALFALAYISTHYYESRFIAFGKILSDKFGGGRRAAAAEVGNAVKPAD